jgi:hypothetical protein
MCDMSDPMRRRCLRTFSAVAVAAAIFLSANRRPSALQAVEKPLAVEPLASPATSGSGDTQAPQMNSSGTRTILSWIELADSGLATLKFSERTASGWSPARVVSSGEDFFVNAADVPSVRALADGTLAAFWLQQNGEGEADNLLLSWSKDDGRTWSKPIMPHHDGTKTQHGFGSLFEAPGGGLGVVWLDGRATKPEAPEGTDAGNMALRSALFDGSGKQRSEVAVDSRVCECCATAVAATAEGPIVAYRNRSAADVRDISVSRLAAGRWSPPVAVSNDGWKIDACPVNGPAISARGREVAVAWFTAKTDGRAFAAFSHDAGRTFTRPIRVDDTAALGRVGIELLNDGSAAVTWVEFTNERADIRVRRVQQSGARGAATTIAPTGGARFPRIAQHGNELLFAWTEAERSGSQHVRTARAPLPTP